MNRDQAEGLMAYLAAAFPRMAPTPEERGPLLGVWEGVLADVDAGDGFQAVKAYVATGVYWPAVADIRRLAAEAKRTRTPSLYLPPVVENPVPRDEIRDVVAAMTAKLKGGF